MGTKIFEKIKNIVKFIHIYPTIYPTTSNTSSKNYASKSFC